MKKRNKIETDDAALTFSPFAGLGSQAVLPDPSEPAPPTAPTAALDLTELSARLVVRRQKKGQGGKTVTCIEGLPTAMSAAVLGRIKRELGCSGRVDGPLLIAGTRDHSRVADWLRRAGASVRLGN